MFADALIAKAREGVRVQLIYDWVGNFGKTLGATPVSRYAVRRSPKLSGHSSKFGR
jgi:phosphatidylserine/phosphatidylglycerophosphate/cardiolipin synthase-like enzyme